MNPAASTVVWPLPGILDRPKTTLWSMTSPSGSPDLNSSWRVRSPMTPARSSSSWSSRVRRVGQRPSDLPIAYAVRSAFSSFFFWRMPIRVKALAASSTVSRSSMTELPPHGPRPGEDVVEFVNDQNLHADVAQQSERQLLQFR